MKTQDQIVAEIATTLTDKPIPTAAEILAGIAKAVQAGRDLERESADAKNERYRKIIAEVLAT